MHFVGIVCGNVAQRLVKLIGNPVVARAVASSGGNWKERVNGEASFIQLQTDTHSHTHKHTGEYVAVKFKVVIEACCQWPTAKEIHPSIQASSDMQRIINNPFTQLQLAQQACGRILFWGCPITVHMCVCVCDSAFVCVWAYRNQNCLQQVIKVCAVTCRAYWMTLGINGCMAKLWII